MCTNGVNVNEFQQMISMIEDHLKIERRWSHNLGHSAKDAGFEETCEKLHEAQAQLDDVLALLGEAKDILEDEASQAQGVTVSLV